MALKKNEIELEVKNAWRRAQELGLKAGELHPLERPAFEAFKRALGWVSD
jgi:hypothetical protein